MPNELDPKVLEAAKTVMYDASPEEDWTWHDVENAINAAFAAADLVERSELKLLLNKPDREVLQLAEERDEARRLAAENGKMLAALHKAIVEFQIDPDWPTRDRLDAVLADTAAAAAQYQLVDDEHVVVRAGELNSATEFIFYEFTNRIQPRKYPDWFNNLVIAAAPKREAGEPEPPLIACPYCQNTVLVMRPVLDGLGRHCKKCGWTAPYPDTTPDTPEDAG